MEFHLRDARREDFDTLWKIDQNCFPPGISYTRMELALYMRRSGAFTLVAESLKGSPARRAHDPLPVLGFLVAEASKRNIGHIITIDVLAGARRTGVGTRLLTAAEERLRAGRCKGIYLETAVDNQSAVSFYQRHGYSLMKTVPRYYSNGVDAFVFRKDLLSPPQAINVAP